MPDPRATYGHPVLGAGADDRGELRGVLGDHHERGRHPVVREAVALVGAQPGAVGDDGPVGQQLAGRAVTPRAATAWPAPGRCSRSWSSSPALLSSVRTRQSACAVRPAPSMPATAAASSLSEVSPVTPTAPSRAPSASRTSTPPGTGTSAPPTAEVTAEMK